MTRLMLCLTAAMVVLTACSSPGPDTDAAPPANPVVSLNPTDFTALACQQAHALPTDLGEMSLEEKNAWGGDVQAMAETAVKAHNAEIAGLGQDTLDEIGDGTAVNAARLILQVNFIQIACDGYGYTA